MHLLDASPPSYLLENGEESLRGGVFHRGVLCCGPACHLCPGEGLIFHEGAAHVTEITEV